MDEEQDGGRYQRGFDHAPCGHLRRLLEIVDKDDGRNGEQVEQVYTDGEPHEVGDEHEPAVGVGLVGHLLPFENGPYDHGRKERGESIDLPFDGREPEGVGEGVGQRTDDAGAQNGPCAGRCEFLAAVSRYPASQVRDAPEEKEDGEGAGQRRHGVHHDRGVFRSGGKKGEEARYHHEERCSGGVSHFEFIGGRDEFGAVPQAGGGLHGEQVNGSGYGEHEPSRYPVVLLEIVHLSAFVLSERFLIVRTEKMRKKYAPVHKSKKIKG